MNRAKAISGAGFLRRVDDSRSTIQRTHQKIQQPRVMAFLNPAALLFHWQHSALLFRKLTPGNEVIVQVGGRVFASASSDPPREPSGPVRYVQKALPPREADGSGRPAPKTRHSNKGWGATQRDPSLDEESKHGDSSTDKTRGYRKPPRARSSNKKASEVSLRTAFPAAERDFSRTNEGEEEGQNAAGPALNSVNYLFGEGHTVGTHVEDVRIDQSGRQTLDRDPGTTARNYVLGLLARGPQTELNLRSKMARKKVPVEVIDLTINDVQRWGLQSDEEYAEVFARCRWTDNTWGPKRIKYELLRKGIQKDKVEAALVKLFQTNDAIEDAEEGDLGKWGMMAEAAEHLMTQARRRWDQGGTAKIDVKKRRLIGWLQRRGFSWSVIRDVLKSSESEETS